MGDWIQIVEFLGDDRPGRVTVERFRKGRDLLAHDRFGICEDQILQRDDLSAGSENVRFAFAIRGLVRARVYDARNDGHGAPHPDFIETRTAHVIGIVRSFVQANTFSRGAKSPACVTVHKLQHPVVLVDAVIENGSGFST